MKGRSVRSFAYVVVGLALTLFSVCRAQAQGNNIGQGNLTWNVNSFSVENGGPNSPQNGNQNLVHGGSNAQVSLGMSLNGINGQGGSASYTCYITFPDGSTRVPSPFPGTTSQNVVVDNQSYNVGEMGTYTSYCTATYTGGRYATGTVSTATLTFQVMQ